MSPSAAKVRIATLVVSGLLSVAVGEVVVRALDITRPSEYQIVDRVLHVQRPYAKYRHTREGYSAGRYNRFGLRDRDSYAKRKPPGAYRILLFGDSHTEALQVEQDLDFDNRLEEALDRRVAQRVEVLNFGLSGTGTADQLLRLKKQGVEFEPDFVLLVFYVGNDFRNNSMECEGDPRRPYFVAAGDGVELDEDFAYGPRRRAVTWLRQSSALFNGSYKTIANWLAGGWTEKRERTELGERAFQRGSLLRAAESREYSREQMFLKQYPPYLEGCVGISFKLIEEFGRTVEGLGADFGVLILPFDLQAQDDMIDAKLTSREDLDFDKPTAIVDAFLEQKGVAAVQVLSRMRAHYAATGRNLYGFEGALHGHLNLVGHEVVAARLEEFFCGNYLECHD